MPRCLPVLAVFLCSAVLVEDTAAQTAERSAPSLLRAAAGLVSGVMGQVTDESGQGIHGASILAMGVTLAVVRTDDDGWFRLALAPGPYVLRATRDGYISTYREAVHIRSDAPLTRTIMLLRSDEAADDVTLASMTQAPPLEGEDPTLGTARPVPDIPGETAWRLRHLPRTALRDEAPVLWQDDGSRPRLTPRDLSFDDFTGRVDFLTTSALAASGERPTDDWPRGVAYVVLGAPVGAHGDWTVGASLAGGEASAWTVAGEYASRQDRPHTFRAGAAYSALTLPDPTFQYSLASTDAVRRVGGVHFVDQWVLPIGLEVDSRLRVERYEYVADPTLVSAFLGLRQRVLPGVFVVASVSPHTVAPGADQFAPPVSSGVWLPPERTFSALDGAGRLRAQEVESYELGADMTMGRIPGADADVVLQLRRFREYSEHQIATLFGLDDASQVGHYYIASPGAVALDGWLLGVSGPLATHVQAAVRYSLTDARWTRGDARSLLRRAERSAARIGDEQLHDVTATVNASVPSTSTQVNVAVRINSGFSRKDALTPGPGARFAFEVRQQLPGTLLGHGEFNILLSAQTLLRQLDTAAGFYDELLTVAPPVRLAFGLQMRF